MKYFRKDQMKGGTDKIILLGKDILSRMVEIESWLSNKPDSGKVIVLIQPSGCLSTTLLLFNREKTQNIRYYIIKVNVSTVLCTVKR